MIADIIFEIAHLTNHPHIGPLGAHDALDNRQYVSLEHSYEAHSTALASHRSSILDGHFTQALDEEHDICARVHVGAFQLLENARVQILIHITVLKRIDGGFLD